MAEPIIEFHFDFGSPNAYLSHCVVPAVEERTGVKFRYVPVLLGGVFKATGNASPAVTLAGIKNKGSTSGSRCSASSRSTRSRPSDPTRTSRSTRSRSCAAIAAESLGCFERYADEVFQHMWSEPKKMDDPDVIRAAFDASDSRPRRSSKACRIRRSRRS